jgi:hypothetical protein
MTRPIGVAVQLVVVLAVACVGLASAVFMRSANAGPFDQPSLSADMSMVRPARTLSGSTPTPVVWQQTADTAPLSITTTMELSSEAAEGVVVNVSAPFFNTVTGDPPADPGPISDDDDVDTEWSLWRTVTFQVTRHYKGVGSNTHLVACAPGGAYDANSDAVADYVEEVRGIDLEDVDIGDEYFLYGLYPFVDPPEEAVGWPWEERGLDLAINMTSEQMPTLFLELYAAYKVDGDTATSETHHAEVAVDWLRQVTEQLAGS